MASNQVDVFPVPEGPVIDVRPTETVLFITHSRRGFPIRFKLGEIPHGSEDRKDHGGPMVPGPWAYAFGLGSYITSDPNRNSGADHRRKMAEGSEHLVRNGSTLRFPSGSVYVVRVRGEYIELGLVT